MHLRLQTWFPFTVHVCVNGREWLAQQLRGEGIGYVQRATAANAEVTMARNDAGSALPEP